MSDGDENTPFRLGAWVARPSLNRLSDGDHVVALEPRVMGVLVCLASRPGKIVSADDLLDTIWDGRAHADNTIYQAVADLRKVLGDDFHNPRYIETIPKKGYRLICPVTPLAADSEMREIASHSAYGRRHGRRILATFAGIASIAVVVILTVRPDFWVRLLPADDGPRDRSIAVLPFVDMSEDGSQQFLSDGISEELIHVLSNLPELRVIARTSSFAFRDKNEDIRKIGRALNVATILEGSIRRDGDRIRITSQLVDTRNGYHLWSKTFDQEASDLFRIQSEIAIAIARTFEFQELDVLKTHDHAAQPDELQTYELYLLGLYQLRSQVLSGYIRAIEYFERAIESDPGFARAYAGLAESYAKRSPGDLEFLGKAESTAEYALSLDDQSAQAFVALGSVKTRQGEYSAAEAAFTKAIEINPNDVQAYTGLARAYNLQGKEDESFDLVQYALTLNPMSAESNRVMGNSYEWRNDWDSAFKFYKRAIELDPDYPGSYNFIAFHYFNSGQLDRAIPYFEKVIDLIDGPIKNSGLHVALTHIYVDVGDYDSASIIIRRMREAESDHFGATNVEIHLKLARGYFSSARDLVHRALSKNIDYNSETSLLAFYEMVIGDTNHAEAIYAHLAAAPESRNIDGNINLCRSNELSWGMMGAVNLAYIFRQQGDTRAVQELLRQARECIESKSQPWFVAGKLYVLAQIAAVEGNSDVATDYFRKAVEAGWTKAWFGRIDPIMVDLRKDTRYLRILEELEDKMLEMRLRTQVFASNQP